MKECQGEIQGDEQRRTADEHLFEDQVTKIDQIIEEKTRSLVSNMKQCFNTMHLELIRNFT